MTHRKTIPTYQYDIFFVAGKGTEFPSGCIPMTEYSDSENGQWVTLITGHGGWTPPGSNEGKWTPPL